MTDSIMSGYEAHKKYYGLIGEGKDKEAETMIEKWREKRRKRQEKEGNDPLSRIE